ncbi:MAG: phosphopantothenate/pantothenate synthetase [archaeon]
MTTIPKSHPRYESLMIRERLVLGFRNGAVVPEGLIAQGRGEAFDYIIGEATGDAALSAIRAAAAMLLLARKPVISVNGNAAALVAAESVRLSRLLDCPLEVNLFYRNSKREKVIEKILIDAGAESAVLGVGGDATERIPGLLHERGKVSPAGIFTADVVLVPLEDGDRTEALCRMGKKVVTVDLSPFSRSARAADVTIVDNIVRCYPRLCDEVERMKGLDESELRDILDGFDNGKNLSSVLLFMKERLDVIACGDMDG